MIHKFCLVRSSSSLQRSSRATTKTLLRCATLLASTSSAQLSAIAFPSPTSAAKSCATTAYSSATASRLCSSTTTTSSETTTTTTIMPSIPHPPNLAAVSDLQPEALWRHFAAIASIPRPSGQEAAVLGYIQQVADAHNCPYQQDAVGNLVVFVNAGPKINAAAPPVIIQGHVDMVTEKNQDTAHNFETDPILLEMMAPDTAASGGQWLTAKGTTLGADNGIGVAAALALLEEATTSSSDADTDAAQYPPLQLLFTVDEETGLTGAQQLDAAALGLTGNVMLNLDTEEWGELYVGCAGGGESILTLPLEKATTSAAETTTTLMELRVEGLLGGHSGVNIHEGRANAILLCAAATQAVMDATENSSSIQLVSLTGGDKHNAIPREASAVLAISTTNDKVKETIQTIVDQSLAAAKDEYGLLETNIKMLLKDADSSASTTPMDDMSARKLLALLQSLPHGPIKYSHAMKDLVETSNNVASVAITTPNDNESSMAASIMCSSRSSVTAALEATRARLKATATLAGASVEQTEAYPGWNPNMKSPLLGIAKEILQRQLDANAEQHVVGVKAIHAGLECGLLIEKLGGNVDALSFGPTITGAHSPDESILTDTVPPFYQLVQDILKDLAKQ